MFCVIAGYKNTCSEAEELIFSPLPFLLKQTKKNYISRESNIALGHDPVFQTHLKKIPAANPRHG